jgi:hypothetical protein
MNNFKLKIVALIETSLYEVSIFIGNSIFRRLYMLTKWEKFWQLYVSCSWEYDFIQTTSKVICYSLGLKKTYLQRRKEVKEIMNKIFGHLDEYKQTEND